MPTLHKELEARRKPSNSYDRYAITCIKKLPSRLMKSVVEHLPKKILRYTDYFMHCRGRVIAKVVDAQHRRLPLIQGGLEIPIEVTVEMDFTYTN